MIMGEIENPSNSQLLCNGPLLKWPQTSGLQWPVQRHANYLAAIHSLPRYTYLNTKMVAMIHMMIGTSLARPVNSLRPA